MGEKKVYQGKNISVSFDAKKCIHSRRCVLGLLQVFQAGMEGDWINADAATCEEIAEVIHRCPSGALSYSRHDGGADEKAPQVNTLELREDGPLTLHGELNIDNKDKCFRATLCRCGASQNKPYCDNAHQEANFKATGEVASKSSEPLEQRNGELAVTSLPDGPLQLKGNLELCCGSGRTIEKTQQAFLCRCGASQNKPYCDGSHMRVGFKS